MGKSRLTKDWARYYGAVGDRPHPTLIQAADAFDAEARRARLAVDLGCGSGRDTLELLRRGWSVIAIDVTQEGLDRLRERAGDAGPRLRLVRARMEDAEWPAADLVNASLVLPFCAPDRFPAVWARIGASLRAGGRFAGHLFGPNDDWAADVLTHTRAEVDTLLSGFEIERLDEIEKEMATAAGGTKQAHMFFIVGRKR